MPCPLISPSANSPRNNLGDTTTSCRCLPRFRIDRLHAPARKARKESHGIDPNGSRVSRDSSDSNDRADRADRAKSKSALRRSSSTSRRNGVVSHLKVFVKDKTRSWRVRTLQRSRAGWAISRILGERKRKQAKRAIDVRVVESSREERVKVDASRESWERSSDRASCIDRLEKKESRTRRTVQDAGPERCR